MTGYEKTVGALKALADPTRLKIFLILSEKEKCACRIQEEFRCTQPTISYHMRVLTECGVVRARREGASTCYSAEPAVAKAVGELLAALTDDDESKEAETDGE